MLGDLGARRDWGYAGDYVRAMWLMLQADEPRDYVIATGELHSVRELVEEAFAHVGLDYREYVKTDARLARGNAELHQLVGDPSKRTRPPRMARTSVDFADLVELLVDADRRAAGRDTRVELTGRSVSASSRPLLTVVVPVFNQAASIVANLDVIRERVGDALGEEFEIVVVSDGSIDATEDELVAQAPGGAFRVFHYDRNLGKGYAVKLGALEAEGEWIGFVDADLDLDPADLAAYVQRAREHNLDFAIGSKRHPDSQVVYPQSRVVASWLFQQLVRLLFRLDVTDTQVGLKVFRREVAEQVLPLLLVKRYAFDIELLAVSRVFGFTRIEEMPIRLDYQFAGSGVRSRAVLRALVDTAAIFYRLRILHYYQRRRRLAGTFGFTRPQVESRLVSVLLPRGEKLRQADFPSVEVIEVDDTSIHGFRAAAARIECGDRGGDRARRTRRRQLAVGDDPVPRPARDRRGGDSEDGAFDRFGTGPRRCGRRRVARGSRSGLFPLDARKRSVRPAFPGVGDRDQAQDVLGTFA